MDKNKKGILLGITVLSVEILLLYFILIKFTDRREKVFYFDIN